MLRTLIRYEWRAVARVCMPMYAGLILVALLTRLMFTNLWRLETVHGVFRMITGVMGALCFGLFVGAMVITILFQIQRFSKNLLGDEGYLMLTLPATVSQHVAAKAIVALVLDVVAMVATGLAIMALAFDGSMWMQVPMGLLQLLLKIHGEIWLVVVEVSIWMLMLCLVETLHLYASIAVGHLFPKHRTLVAFGAYFGFFAVGQILINLSIELMGTSWLKYLLGWVEGLNWLGGHIAIWLAIVITFAVGAALFQFIRYILENKLNLE